MINENELIISNKSYINKDFATIYPELLSLAKKLSHKYNPETSNESDPFIVVLKLLAFVADKLNYNVDKNVLERFMPSATQVNTMRDLTSMMGYDMNYYIAPETTVTIKYVGDAEFTDSHQTFTLPAFDTIVSDDSGETQFVLVENYVIEGHNVTQLKGGRVLQGIKQRLTVLSGEDETEKIQLANLDENNRIYFSEKKVAQNGVFISGGNITSTDSEDGFWTRVTNLNVQPSNSFVYKFGFDSNKGYPYIEFPGDIANLIGSGLTIDYIVTDGLSGNISSKFLTKLKSPSVVYWDNSSQSIDDKISLVLDDESKAPVVVNNVNGTINGRDPEDINTAYSNFKKIIGTFDTLVTCRDYANAIYSLIDNEGIYPVVSNVQVADRRTDYNYSTSVVTYSEFFGKEYVNVVKSGVTPYDLMLYPLTSFKTSSVEAYKNSFTPLQPSYLNYITSALEDSQSISHDYKDLENTDVYVIKNYYNLKAFISTTTKVTNTEGAAILSNINKALVDKFNAREVDYGYEIPYDVLLSTIEKADERIKSVSLYEPELETKFLTKNGIEYPLFYSSSDTSEDKAKSEGMFIELVAKNVLGGRVKLFAYYDKFDFELGQRTVNGSEGSTKKTLDLIYNDVESVTTNANITVPTSSDGYTLVENEVIQIVSPSLITKTTYPYGINYYLQLTEGRTSIPEGASYELKSGEVCVFEYTDTNDNQVVNIYKHTTDAPTIICPNVELETTVKRISDGKTHLSKLIKKQIYKDELSGIITEGMFTNFELKMFSLQTNEQVEHKTINKVKLNKTSYCTWIMNNESNTIPWSNNQYMLQEGEYFFTTDLGFNELYSYGSGTVLTKTTSVSSDWSVKKIDVAVLDDLGLLGHQEYFTKITLNDTAYFTFTEQEIITLTKGDKIKASTSFALSNDFGADVGDKGIEYKFTDDTAFTVLPIVSYTGSYRKARARLDINCGPNHPQKLINNQTMEFKLKNSANKIKIGAGYPTGSESVSAEECVYVKLEREHQLSGGNDISLVTVNLNDVNTKLYDSVCLYNIDDTYKGTNTRDNFESISLKSGTGKVSTKTYKLPVLANHNLVTMIYVSEGTVDISSTDSTIKEALSDTEVSSLTPGIHSIRLVADEGESEYSFTLELASGVSKASIIMRVPRYVTVSSSNTFGLNVDGLGLTTYTEKTAHSMSDLISDLVTKISTIDTDDKFYCCNDIDKSKVIELEDLASPYALYDYNNVANKWVLSEINFSDSQPDIVITRKSMI